MIGLQNYNDMNIIEYTLNKIKEAKQKVESGGVNSIPSPFKRFRNSFIGVQQSKYYIVTASTKAGKSQFASYSFIYMPLLYCYKYKDKARLKILYFPLEESKERVVLRFMSFLLYHLSNHTIQLSPENLLSTSNTPLSDNIVNLLESDKYKDILNYFNEVVQFSEERNPTGIYREALKYAEENGKVVTKKYIAKNEFGTEEERETFSSYTPNDDGEYRILFVDHLGLVATERGFSLKQSMDKLSEYMVILRNQYGYSPVIIQQQVFESMDNFKMDKLRPSLAGLGDSKYSSRDANFVIGIYSPYKHEIKSYFGYDVTKFKDKIRFIEVLANRDGISNDITALYFNGSTCYFEQLPLPNDPTMSNVYSKLESGNVYVFTMVHNIKTKIKEWLTW